MKIKINDRVSVRRIDETWNCCKYVYRVFLTDYTFADYKEVEATLKEWFGEVEYFWENMWLCQLKEGCENKPNLYCK